MMGVVGRFWRSLRSLYIKKVGKAIINMASVLFSQAPGTYLV